MDFEIIFNSNLELGLNSEIINSLKNFKFSALSSLKEDSAFVFRLNKDYFIYRDFIGKYNIYFYSKDGVYFFSNNIEEIIIKFNCEINTQRVAKYLNDENETEFIVNTFFENTYAAPPGYLTIIKNSNLEFKKINFNFKYTNQNLEDRLKASIKIKKHNSKIFTTLSGGLDSSLIALFLNDFCKYDKNLNTIELIHNGTIYEERIYANEIKNLIFSENFEINLSSNFNEILENEMLLQKIICQPTSPIINSNRDVELYSLANRKEAKFLFFGIGGDDIFQNNINYLEKLMNTDNVIIFSQKVKNLINLLKFENYVYTEKVIRKYFFGKLFSLWKKRKHRLFVIFLFLNLNQFKINISLKILKERLFKKFINNTSQINLPKNNNLEINSDLIILNLNLDNYYLNEIFYNQNYNQREILALLSNYFNIKTVLPYYNKDILSFFLFNADLDYNFADGYGRFYIRELLKKYGSNLTSKRLLKSEFSNFLFYCLKEYTKNYKISDDSPLWIFVSKTKFNSLVNEITNLTVFRDEKRNFTDFKKILYLQKCYNLDIFLKIYNYEINI